MDVADHVLAVQIGEGTGDAQHLLIAACREPHRFRGLAQEREAGLVGLRDRFKHGAARLGVGVPIEAKGAVARCLDVASLSDARLDVGAAFRGRRQDEVRGVTAGTLIRRSMWSSSGPERRA